MEGDARAVEFIADRLEGKPRQSLDISASRPGEAYEDMTDEELIAEEMRLAEIEAKHARSIAIEAGAATAKA